MLTIKYVFGDTLDKSYFVATDAKEPSREEVVRASSVIPQSLHKLAAANKLKTEPEDYITELTKLCTDLDSFVSLTAEMAAGARELKVEAKDKGDAPVTATEPTPDPKKQDAPVTAADETYTQKPKDMTAAPDTKQFFNRLPAKAPGNPEIAVDVNSSDPKATIQALAEELQKKDAEIGKLKSDLQQKTKDDELEEVIELLQDIGVDAKEVERLKKELSSLPEQAIGVLESVLKTCAKKVHGDKGGPPKSPADKGGEGAPAGGAPPFAKKAASADDLSLAARNITAAVVEDENFGGDAGIFATKWVEADLVKERQPITSGR